MERWGGEASEIRPGWVQTRCSDACFISVFFFWCSFRSIKLQDLSCQGVGEELQQHTSTISSIFFLFFFPLRACFITQGDTGTGPTPLDATSDVELHQHGMALQLEEGEQSLQQNRTLEMWMINAMRGL